MKTLLKKIPKAEFAFGKNIAKLLPYIKGSNAVFSPVRKSTPI